MDPARESYPDAPHLRWGDRPVLSKPMVIAAFEGWNDAGDAATAAVSYLHDQWDAQVIADIDPEEFFDFTATRPRVEIDEHDIRRIIWPANEVSVAVIPTTGRDVVLIRGVEPQLKWRTFAEHVLALAQHLDADIVVTIGALLAEVPHSRPVSVFGAAYEEAVIDELGLSASRYEGPTGIVGVLHAACHDAGMRSASLWAAVPTYVPGAPSPKAALALVERICLLLGTSVDTTSLEIASAAYDHQVTELVSEDEETEEYVAALEQRYDDETFGDPTLLVEQVERFLRDQRD